MNPHITIETSVHAPLEKVWDYFTNPEHITKWCHASDDWHAPSASNDLTVGGTFTTRMESTDGTHGFDFNGTYTTVEEYNKIEYTIEGGRTVEIRFIPEDTGCTVIETFEAENKKPC